MRGGTRPGSGRKASPLKRITIAARVTEATREQIQELKAEGYQCGKIVEEGVGMLYRVLKGKNQ